VPLLRSRWMIVRTGGIKVNRNAVWSDLAGRLVAALRPIAAPIGITFVPQSAASDASKTLEELSPSVGETPPATVE